MFGLDFSGSFGDRRTALTSDRHQKECSNAHPLTHSIPILRIPSGLSQAAGLTPTRTSPYRMWPDDDDVMSEVDCHELSRAVNDRDIARVRSILGGKKKPRQSALPDLLSTAVRLGSIEMVSLLSEVGNIDAKAANGETPLFHAVQTRRLDVVELLLSKKANANMVGGGVDRSCLMHEAVRAGCDIVEALIAHKAVVDCADRNSSTPLHLAAHSGALDVAEVLVAHGANINAMDRSGISPLYKACGSGNLGIVRLLLDAKAEISNNGPRPLTVAVHHCRLEVVQLLIEYNASVNVPSGKPSPLHSCNYPELVAELIRAQADVNARDSNGRQPLHLCMNSTVAKLLLDSKADALAVVDGFTPLMHAVRRNHPLLARTFCTYNADPNTRFHTGESLLHNAAAVDSVSNMLEELIQCGAKANIRHRTDRSTPLHYAAARVRPPRRARSSSWVRQYRYSFDSQHRAGPQQGHQASPQAPSAAELRRYRRQDAIVPCRPWRPCRGRNDSPRGRSRLDNTWRTNSPSEPTSQPVQLTLVVGAGTSEARSCVAGGCSYRPSSACGSPRLPRYEMPHAQQLSWPRDCCL